MLEWMADDAAEPLLSSCLWDPVFRQGHLAPGDFELRVVLAETPAPVPERSVASGPRDWTGLTCRHSVPARCAPERTCPASIWEEQPCPSP